MHNRSVRFTQADERFTRTGSVCLVAAVPNGRRQRRRMTPLSEIQMLGEIMGTRARSRTQMSVTYACYTWAKA